MNITTSNPFYESKPTISIQTTFIYKAIFGVHFQSMPLRQTFPNCVTSLGPFLKHVTFLDPFNQNHFHLRLHVALKLHGNLLHVCYYAHYCVQTQTVVLLVENFCLQGFKLGSLL